MANEKKGPPPAPLEQALVKKLLDLLESDEDFRRLFEKYPQAALADIGYVAPAGAAECLQFADGAKLASADKIKQARSSLESMLSVPFTYTCPAAMQE